MTIAQCTGTSPTSQDSAARHCASAAAGEQGRLFKLGGFPAGIVPAAETSWTWRANRKAIAIQYRGSRGACLHSLPDAQ